MVGAIVKHCCTWEFNIASNKIANCNYAIDSIVNVLLFCTFNLTPRFHFSKRKKLWSRIAVFVCKNRSPLLEFWQQFKKRRSVCNVTVMFLEAQKTNDVEILFWKKLNSIPFGAQVKRLVVEDIHCYKVPTLSK